MIRDPATQNPSNGVGNSNGRHKGSNGALSYVLLLCIT